MELVPIVMLGTLVFTFVIFVKNLTARQWSSAITQFVAWTAGVCGILIMAATEFAAGITIGDTTLDRLGFWSKLLVGVLAASLLSTLNEFKKAFDHNDTAAVPNWFEIRREAPARRHVTLPNETIRPEDLEETRRQVRTGGMPYS